MYVAHRHTQIHTHTHTERGGENKHFSIAVFLEKESPTLYFLKQARDVPTDSIFPFQVYTFSEAPYDRACGLADLPGRSDEGTFSTGPVLSPRFSDVCYQL